MCIILSPITKPPPKNKNLGPSLILENFRLANWLLIDLLLENNLKIKLPFVGFAP